MRKSHSTWIVFALLAFSPLASSQQCDTLSASATTKLAKVDKLYHLLISPCPVIIMTQGLNAVSDIFDSNVKGRVTPAGTFLDSQAVLEYFFGLAVTPGSMVTAVDLKILMESGNRVAVRADITFDARGTPSGRIFTLTQTGFFTFSDTGKIAAFDLTILNLGAAVDPRSSLEAVQNILGVCTLLTMGFGAQPATCPGEFSGPNATTKFQNCVQFMNSIPYGSWNRANSNTFVCRQLHSLLTPFRPDVHCSHVGKTGGDSCIDFPYESFYLVDVFED